jgi:serine/threonine protein kinase
MGHQDGVDFLVMEYLEGESLADRLRRSPISLKETVPIGMEVREALDTAHRAQIVHRDLKPGNIMLTKRGAKLMDFGLAKAALTGMAAHGAAAPIFLRWSRGARPGSNSNRKARMLPILWSPRT